MKNSYFPLRPEPLVSYKLSRVALGTRMRLFFTPCQESRSLIGRKGHVNTSDDVRMLMSHVTLKNNTPIVFLAL